MIGLSWSPGLSDGGTQLIDYKLWYALENDVYTVLEENLLSSSYTTTISLQAGSTYKFKVQSRTAYGYSEDSSEVYVKVARIPDVPANVQTSQLGSNVVISWSEPYNGGSVITSYDIQI